MGLLFPSTTSDVYLTVAIKAQSLEVAPSVAEVTAFLLGAPAFHLGDVVNAACSHHLPTLLAPLAERIGLEFGIAQVSPLLRVHEPYV